MVSAIEIPAGTAEAVAKALGFHTEPRPLQEGVVTRALRGHVELRGVGGDVERLPRDIIFRIQVTRVGRRLRVILDTKM